MPVSGIAPATGGTFITGTGTSLTSDPMPAFDAKAFEAADKACAPILEAAGIKTFTSSSVGDAGSGPVLGSGGGIIGGAAVLGGAAAGAGDLAAMVAPIKKYAACMREQGVDVPDPVVDEKAGTFEMKLDVDPTASDFRAADAACADGGFSFAVPARPAGGVAVRIHAYPRGGGPAASSSSSSPGHIRDCSHPHPGHGVG